MYSGITSGLFEVVQVNKQTGLLAYTLRLNEALCQNLTIGASIAVDGVCQTVVAIQGLDVSCQAIQETLEKTTLSALQTGSLVSIERSLRYGDEMGGHEVAGHVVGTGKIIETRASDNNLALKIQCPADWMKYIFSKGFIAVDGSSLTVGEVDPKGSFTLHLIPETLRVTKFAHKKVGDLVNIELDHRTQAIVSTVERVMATGSSLCSE